MKIVFLLPSLKTGGGNRVVIELANLLVLKSFNVDIIFPNNSADTHTFPVSSGVCFHSVGTFREGKIAKFVNLLKFLVFVRRKYSTSIKVVTDPIMSIFMPIAGGRDTFRFIQADDYALYDDLSILKSKSLLAIYKKLATISFKYKMNFIFNSKYSYKKYCQAINIKGSDYKLVHPAIDHDRFKNLNVRSNDELNLCIVARKHPLKGFVDFITAYPQIKSKTEISNVYVISHDDLSSFNLHDFKIIKPEKDDDITNIMNRSHVFISTSWWEGFGLPPLEAMACGCAVVLSDSGGVNEYAEPGKNCLMYSPKNVKELENAVIKLCQGHLLRNKIANAGVISAQQFSWEKSLEQFLDAIKNESQE